MANGLTAEDYQGLNPKQIATIRQLGQQDRQTDVQLAQALEGAKQQRVKQKLQAVSMAINAKLQKRKQEIDAQRAEAYDKMAEANKLQAETAADQYKLKLDKLDRKRERFDKYKNMELETTQGTMSLAEVKAYQDAGAPLKAYGGDEVLHTWRDDEDNIKYTVLRNGIIEVTDNLEGLAGGFEKLAEKTEVEKLGPREKTYEREKGKQIANIDTPEFVTDVEEQLTESSWEYRNLSRGYPVDEPMPEAPTKKEKRRIERKSKQKARTILREKVANNIKNIHSDRVFGKFDVVFAEEGPKGRGFYLVTPDRDPEYIRGDVK